jgi:MFS transporter, UMF1 family
VYLQVVVPKLFILGSLLVVTGVTCLGSSFVLLNSFLPLLSANDPSVQASHDHAKGSTDGIALQDRSEANNLNHENDNDFSASRPSTRSSTRSSTKVSSPELELSTKISSKGVGLGYIAAVIMQLVSIALLFAMKKISTNPSSQTLPLRLVLFVVGVWWLAFSVPTYLYLKDRPGPPLVGAPGVRYWQHVIYAWSGLWKTIKIASKLREAVIFLIAWFLLSDAIATVSGTAVLFARTELQMDTIPIALLSITVMVSGEYSSSHFSLENRVLLTNSGTPGILGAFSWPITSRRFALKTNQTIVICIALMEIIPLYGLLGYLPFVRAWGVGGLQQAWEIYPLGFVHGFVMGGLSSYCRSFFGLLIPPGSEAAFYALYAITDKGSSAIGPAMVGVIVDVTGSIRLAFGFLAVLILLPLPLMWMINARRGQEDAVRMSGVKREREQEWDETEEAEGLLRREE